MASEFFLWNIFPCKTYVIVLILLCHASYEYICAGMLWLELSEMVAFPPYMQVGELYCAEIFHIQLSRLVGISTFNTCSSITYKIDFFVSKVLGALLYKELMVYGQKSLMLKTHYFPCWLPTLTLEIFMS